MNFPLKIVIRDDFTLKKNSQKRFWFFKNFLKDRTYIQNEFYNYLQNIRYKKKLELSEDYASENKRKFIVF